MRKSVRHLIWGVVLLSNLGWASVSAQQSGEGVGMRLSNVYLEGDRLDFAQVELLLCQHRK